MQTLQDIIGGSVCRRVGGSIWYLTNEAISDGIVNDSVWTFIWDSLVKSGMNQVNGFVANSAQKAVAQKSEEAVKGIS